MRIDRHVYGSVMGYQTLASSDGVTAADLQALEAFGVGQSSDPSFFRSLAGQPAWIMRTIGHRRALTRVSPGRPDDANRQTTLRVSLLIPAADWDSVLRGDIGSLTGKSELWEWKGESVLPALNASLHGPGVPMFTPAVAQKLLSILSLIERAWSSRRPVVLRENSLTLDEFRILGMLIPPQARPGYCAVYRSLTADLAASLICLAAQSPVRQSAETFRAGQSVELSPYATALVNAGFASGRFPLEYIQSYRSFGMTPKPAASTTPKSVPRASIVPCEVIVERMPRPLLVTLILACIVLPVVSGICTWVYAKGHYVSSTVQAVIAGLPVDQMSSEARNKLYVNCEKQVGAIPKWARQEVSAELGKLKTDRQDRAVLFPADQDLNTWLKIVLFPTASNRTEKWPNAARLVQDIKKAADDERTKDGHQIVILPENIKLWLTELASDSGAQQHPPNSSNPADVLGQEIKKLLNDRTGHEQTQVNEQLKAAKHEVAAGVIRTIDEALASFDPGKVDASINELLGKLNDQLQSHGKELKVAGFPEAKQKALHARSGPIAKKLKEYKSRLDKTAKEKESKSDGDLAAKIEVGIKSLERLVESLKEWKTGTQLTPCGPDLDVIIEMLGNSDPTVSKTN